MGSHSSELRTSWNFLHSPSITVLLLVAIDDQRCGNLCQDLPKFALNPRPQPSGLLQPLPIPQRPWSHLSIDFVTDLPLSNGFTTILIITDRFSKACCLIPLLQPWKWLKHYSTMFSESMVFLRILFLTEEPNLPLRFGEPSASN